MIDIRADIKANALNPDYSIAPLAVAIIVQALHDARKGNDYAREWLYNDGALWLDILRGLHPDYSRRFFDRLLGERKPKQKRATRPQDERKAGRTGKHTPQTQPGASLQAT